MKDLSFVTFALILGALAVAVGFVSGQQIEDKGRSGFAAEFEQATGINWHSFIAAKKDCEHFFQTTCKLDNGWTPRAKQ